ncbi:MAG: hypothetical protein K0B87_05170 [Candidatus Syntrophosphaera sp.]|nr:hypothetical protein [Candidatus Syntrophosphaera sp.]
MKMSFLFGHIFWGVLLLLWGLSLILKGLNIVDLPLVKIFFAVVIILIGVRLLVGGGSWTRIKTSGTRHGVITSGGSEYSSVFASQNIDLTDLKPDSRPLEITAVFGSAFVQLPDDIDFVFEPTSVFGATVIPTKPAAAQANPKGTVYIEANAVFGRVEFVYKPAKRSPYQGASAAPDSTREVPSDSL